MSSTTPWIETPPATDLPLAMRADGAQMRRRAQSFLPPITLVLEFSAPTPDEVRQAADWLADALEIQPGESEGPHAGHSTADQFLRCCLAVCRLFLELARLPVFDVPRVASLQLAADGAATHRATIEIQRIASVQPGIYQSALGTAVELCKWMARTPLAPDSKVRLYERIRDRVIKPLQAGVHGGGSTIPVLRVAHALGIPYIHLGLGIYQLGWGSKGRRMDRSTTEHDPAMAMRLSQDKVAASELMRFAGLPTAPSAVVRSEDAAAAAAGRIGYPVVIKPTDRDRGEGVTVNIVDVAQVGAAFRAALALSASKQVLVEKQIPGVCHRLFIAGGALLYAVKRLPTSVWGDGVHTIGELADQAVQAQERLPPWSRTPIQRIDDLAVQTLQLAGLTADSIPERGCRVGLRPIESTEWGGFDEDVTDAIHPQNLTIALEAASLFGLHMAGIDIISSDVSRPWQETGAVINEVNFAPLLGGGDISRRHIPRFLQEFMGGDGTIPIEMFDASAAETARARQRELAGSGVRCYLTTADATWDPSGRELPMTAKGIYARLLALLLRRGVDAVHVIRPS